MADINKIILKIDDFLERIGLDYIDAIRANTMLEEAGLLSANSNHRPGSMLRAILRNGQIPHAFQKSGGGSKWLIPHSCNVQNSIYTYPRKSKSKSVGNIEKGKRAFTISEIESIKRLLKEKQNATSIKQKGIRQKIRDIGFYYSSFDLKKYSYDLIGFESLIQSGQIKIVLS